MSGVFGADVSVMLHRRDGWVDGEECVLKKQKNRIKKRKMLDKKRIMRCREERVLFF